MFVWSAYHDIYQSPCNSAEPKCQKSFFKSDTVNFKWNATGSHLLAVARTSSSPPLPSSAVRHSIGLTLVAMKYMYIDARQGTSYYGQSSLHLLASDGSISSNVGSGAVEDVAWSPSGKDFCSIQGTQPAKATLYLAEGCKPVHHHKRLI
jgi:translation initiation factor 2A